MNDDSVNQKQARCDEYKFVGVSMRFPLSFLRLAGKCASLAFECHGYENVPIFRFSGQFRLLGLVSR